MADRNIIRTLFYFSDMDYTVHHLIQSCLIWRWVALLVKMCTTVALVSSQMKLIYQMSFQVVTSFIKECLNFVSSVWATVDSVDGSYFIVFKNWSSLELNYNIGETLNYLPLFLKSPTHRILKLFLKGLWICFFVCLFHCMSVGFSAHKRLFKIWFL